MVLGTGLGRVTLGRGLSCEGSDSLGTLPGEAGPCSRALPPMGRGRRCPEGGQEGVRSRYPETCLHLLLCRQGDLDRQLMAPVPLALSWGQPVGGPGGRWGTGVLRAGHRRGQTPAGTAPRRGGRGCPWSGSSYLLPPALPLWDSTWVETATKMLVVSPSADSPCLHEFSLHVSSIH